MLLIALYGPRNLRGGRSSYVNNYTSFTLIYGPCNTPSFIIIEWKAVRMCALHVVVFIVHYCIPTCYNEYQTWIVAMSWRSYPTLLVPESLQQVKHKGESRSPIRTLGMGDVTGDCGIFATFNPLIPRVLIGERDRPYSLFAIRFHVAKIPQSPVLQLVLLEIE